MRDAYQMPQLKRLISGRARVETSHLLTSLVVGLAREGQSLQWDFHLRVANPVTSL